MAGVIVLFGVAGIAIAFSGAAGFMEDQTLFRFRQPPLDGFVGEDQFIDGKPVNRENTLPLVIAIVAGIVIAMFGLALGVDQVLVWMGR